jgi:hypothetical protein
MGADCVALLHYDPAAEVVRPRLNSGGKARSLPAPPEQAVETGKVPLADRKDVPVEQAAQARAMWIGSSRIGSEAHHKASSSRISSGVGVTGELEFNAAGAKRQPSKLAVHSAYHVLCLPTNTERI